MAADFGKLGILIMATCKQSLQVEQCTIPPKGWICQRGSGHAGPCAASPLPDGMTEGQYWYSRWWDAVADDEAAQAITALTAENERLREALTPSGATKGAYHGEFTFETEDGVSNAGIERWRKVYVPWTTVKEIMKAISDRAALKGKS